MKFILHITTENERIDNIAYKYYANEMRIQEILAVNPHIGLMPILSPGITVAVPIDEKKEDKRGLPVWKQ